MTKKNYVAIAEIIKKEVIRNGNGINELTAIRRIVYDLCGYFRADNPLFQETKFLSACFPVSGSDRKL